MECQNWEDFGLHPNKNYVYTASGNYLPYCVPPMQVTRGLPMLSSGGRFKCRVAKDEPPRHIDFYISLRASDDDDDEPIGEPLLALCFEVWYDDSVDYNAFEQGIAICEDYHGHVIFPVKRTKRRTNNPLDKFQGAESLYQYWDVEAAFNAFERIENDLTDQVFDVSFYEEYIKNPGAVLKEYCSRA